MQQGITPTQKFVLLALADRADEQNRCWPSIARLEADTCFDRKAILRALKSLEEKGLLIAKKENGKSNVYFLVGVSSREKTSASLGTDQCPKGDSTSASLGHGPVPKGGHESKREPKREPNNKLNLKALRSDGENADAPPDAPLEQPAVYELPLRSKAKDRPKLFPVVKEHFDAWSEAYPLVDVRQELKAIKAWLVSNPTKRPASDMLRFVNSWLKREQDKLAVQQARASPLGRPIATTQAQKQNQDKEDMARLAIAAKEALKNGDFEEDNGGTQHACSALPAIHVSRGVISAG
jgi:hypothetical protein